MTPLLEDLGTREGPVGALSGLFKKAQLVTKIAELKQGPLKNFRTLAVGRLPSGVATLDLRYRYVYTRCKG